MSLFSRKPDRVPEAAEALPGRDTPSSPRPRRHDGARHAAACRRSRTASTACWSAWAASGAPSASSGRPRRLHDGGRLRRRHHAEPDLPRGLLAAAPATPRSCWSSTTRQCHARRGAADLLGGPRPDPGHAPGQRRRHAVPVGHLLAHAGAAGRCDRHARRLPGGAARATAAARSPPRSPRPAPSTPPRTTTSSTCTKTRRLLRHRRHRRLLPDRHRRQRRLTVRRGGTMGSDPVVPPRPSTPDSPARAGAPRPRALRPR